MSKYKIAVIGIDQSYKYCGISICCDGEVKKITGINLNTYPTKSEKRAALKKFLTKIVEKIKPKSEKIICVVERIRLFSKGFVNIDYITSIGALNGCICDSLYLYNIPVYSVDTRCWKSTVVGTTKKQKNNYGVPEEKWPTIKWVIENYGEQNVLEEVKTRKNKGTFIRDGKKYRYNDDKADSAAISLFYFKNKKDKLILIN